jgi:hypothetical protein
MSLPVQRVDDFVEAHEIADQGQIFAMPCLIRVRECSGNDVAQLGDVAYVNARSLSCCQMTWLFLVAG